VTDWKARAEREAAALLDECGGGLPADRDQLIAVLAAAWLQGCNYGMHDALAHVDATFEELRAAL
jgi:hypothetical protein